MITTRILFLFSLAVAVSTEAVIQLEGNEIYPAGRVSQAALKTVHNFKSCGGHGQLLQWRYADCKDSVTTCEARADRVLRRSQVDFIPSRDISTLGVIFKINSIDGKVNKEFKVDEPILNQGLKNGQAYSITNVGGVSEDFKGKLSRFQYILYDQDTNEVEICADALIQYV